ncbi:MAG: hypothetical protein AB9917_05210 [Negativicutes bacterium]
MAAIFQMLLGGSNLYKKVLIVIAVCFIMVSFSVEAAPLTSFETHKGSIELGVWKTNSIFENDEIPFLGQVAGKTHQGRYMPFGGITYGLHGKWGVQYYHHGLGTSEKQVGTITMTVGGSSVTLPVNSQIKGHTDEFNILYSLSKNLALFGGINCGYTNQQTRFVLSYDRSNTQNLFQIGIIGKTSIGANMEGYLLSGIGAHGLFQGELGVSLNMGPKWQSNLAYRWLKVNDGVNKFTDVNGGTSTKYSSSFGTVKSQGFIFRAC